VLPVLVHYHDGGEAVPFLETAAARVHGSLRRCAGLLVLSGLAFDFAYGYFHHGSARLARQAERILP
jgi:hypothetical protein